MSYYDFYKSAPVSPPVPRMAGVSLIPQALLLGEQDHKQGHHPVDMVVQTLRKKTQTGRDGYIRDTLSGSTKAQVLYDYCLEHGITKLAPLNWQNSLARHSMAHRWVLHDVLLYGASGYRPHILLPGWFAAINTWLVGGAWVQPNNPHGGIMYELQRSLEIGEGYQHTNPDVYKNIPMFTSSGAFGLMSNMDMLCPRVRWMIAASEHLPYPPALLPGPESVG